MLHYMVSVHPVHENMPSYPEHAYIYILSFGWRRQRSTFKCTDKKYFGFIQHRWYFCSSFLKAEKAVEKFSVQLL